MQMVDSAARQNGVLGEQVTKGRHRRLPPSDADGSRAS
jgi:hypothetical protein